MISRSMEWKKKPDSGFFLELILEMVAEAIHISRLHLQPIRLP